MTQKAYFRCAHCKDWIAVASIRQFAITKHVLETPDGPMPCPGNNMRPIDKKEKR